ncbi:MAG: class I SAM-dependent methyltransferase [Candidatus Omnitrophica bacterium]|nr:class I SAM-dependent methyltransferase [Candidatus Omnitrophota bacterium]
MTGIEKQKLLLQMLDKFDPASSLWRTIEVAWVMDVLSELKVCGLTLDLGCGEGNISGMAFKSSKVSLVGLDNWQELLFEAKLSGVYKSLVLSDARFMPFKDSKFDNVFSNSVIEHIEDIDKVAEEVSRVLKPGGLFIFTVPSDKFGDYLFFYRLFKGLGLKRIADWYKNKRIALLAHYNLHDKDGWAKKLDGLGLKIIESRFYLSKGVLSLWDLIAAFGFLLKKLNLRGDLLKVSEQIQKKIFYAFFRRLITEKSLNNDSSAGLLAIARKLN